MTDAPKHEHVEHKAPAKKRLSSKMVFPRNLHAELERQAFFRKLTDALNSRRVINNQQIKALSRKILKREETIRIKAGTQ